jgi:kynurenine formamidase
MSVGVATHSRAKFSAMVAFNVVHESPQQSGEVQVRTRTLGSDQARRSAFVIIHLTWSEPSANPLTFAEILTNLGPGLHEWLHDSGSRLVGIIRFESGDAIISSFGSSLEM